MDQLLEHRRRLGAQYEEHVNHPIGLDAGRIAVCGEQGGTGHHVIVHVRPDRCLDILDIVEEAQVSQACERLQNLPLTGRTPYKFRYQGKWWAFKATYRWPLIGVCRPDRETVLLLSSVDAGLMITGVWEEGCQSIFEEDWRVTFDLGGATPDTRAPEQASSRAAKRPARRVDDVQASHGAKPPHARADAVQAEYTRLACGRVAEVALEAFGLHLDHLGRQTAVPHPRFGDHHKARLHAPAVLMGLRTVAAKGCLRLCGREKAIREQFARFGVYLPKGGVAPVLRLLIELGCVFVWQLPAAKDRGFSKRYSIEVGEVLKPDERMHLAMLRATPTPHGQVRSDDRTLPAAAREQVAVEATRTTMKPPPGRGAPAPTLREFLRHAVGLMLVLGRDVLEEYELAVASLTTAQAAGSASPGVAAPGPVPTEREMSPLSVSPALALQEGECGPPSKAGQADAAGGQGVGQRWSFAAAISSAQLDMAAAGRWAEAVDDAWHALAWPLPRAAASPADVDPPLKGDMLIEPGRPSRADETLWLQGPAPSRVVQPLGGVVYVAPRIATRPWIAAHVARSDAGPRGPPRRRARDE